uniref:AlNc14C34G3086 protein n=1 Tax=Albugo laibachii Nc14 TaxID=890382 RepID=F0W8F6_9STRA|nr:AlNc14C34G3086 [Albugo laibachii Nc14]|eukprot:CCA17411.1 AlNc14C34G3086 [Albugo laibachii Nc14]
MSDSRESTPFIKRRRNALLNEPWSVLSANDVYQQFQWRYIYNCKATSLHDLAVDSILKVLPQMEVLVSLEVEMTMGAEMRTKLALRFEVLETLAMRLTLGVEMKTNLALQVEALAFAGIRLTLEVQMAPALGLELACSTHSMSWAFINVFIFGRDKIFRGLRALVDASFSE